MDQMFGLKCNFLNAITMTNAILKCDPFVSWFSIELDMSEISFFEKILVYLLRVTIDLLEHYWLNARTAVARTYHEFEMPFKMCGVCKAI